MKKILITGGAGFLGKRLALRLKDRYDITLASRNNKLNFQALQYTGCRSVPLDVTRMESIRDLFSEFRPDIVIHAAATKFVDLAEQYPMECVDVNVLGSQNVIRACVEFDVESALAISTDKAAPPVRNTYGLSKALMERAFCSMNGKGRTKFLTVRYGNVAWSTGSVLPIWKKMFENTGVIGTTGPEMRRFFFTVNEAVELVETALLNAEAFQGKVLSRRMKAARMEDILKTWVKHKGGRYEHISGRPGERNDEYLIGELELNYTTEIEINGVIHYLISFNDKSSSPLTEVVSSANVERLSEREILDIIENPPFEEQ